MAHLVHPALVHFTVAFLVVGTLTEATALLLRREGGARWGGALTLLGTIAALPTIVAGFVAEASAPIADSALRLVDRHERLGLMLLGVLLTLAVVKAWGRGKIPEGARVLYALGLLAACALAAATAVVGGSLVYGLGVGVAR